MRARSLRRQTAELAFKSDTKKLSGSTDLLQFRGKGDDYCAFMDPLTTQVESSVASQRSASRSSPQTHPAHAAASFATTFFATPTAAAAARPRSSARSSA